MANAAGILLLGITIGLGYGLLAIGLVLIYRASRFVNFAQGQMGAIAAILLAKLALDRGVPYGIALVVALVVGGITGVLIDRLVVQRLFNASRLILLVATIGVAQLLFVPAVVKNFGPFKNPFLPNPERLTAKGYPVPFHIQWVVGNRVITSSEIITLLLAPAIAIGLYLFFARTATGKAIRAASSNAEAARLAGISVRRISLIVWTVAGVLSALTAVLQSPGKGSLDLSNLGPSLLLRGLAAALIGGMVDFRLAFVAGIGIGIVEQTALFNLNHINGIADLAVGAAVLLAIAVRGRALARTSRRGDDRLLVEKSKPPLSERLKNVTVARNIGHLGWAALVLVALVLPLVPGLDNQGKAAGLVLICSFALIGLSLTVLTGWAGQVSLGHYALLGVGAYTAAHADGHHWALPAVLLVAGAVSSVTLVIVGLPAIRFRGLFLAVSTLAFALVAQSWLFHLDWVGAAGTGNASILHTRLPGIGPIGSQRSLYYVALAVLALVILGLRAFRASAVGRSLVAVRDNENQAAAHGLSAVAVKVVALAVSGFLAGVAGGLWSMATVNFSFQAFDATTSLTLLSLVMVGGLGTLDGPIYGALAVFGYPLLVAGANRIEVRAFTSGVLLLIIVLFVPGGLSSLVGRARLWLLGWIERGLPERPFGPVAEADPLVATDVSIRFGGLQAVDEASITVGRREIVGLIGGNGAGKSTLMNCISGHLQADSGHVALYGQDVTGLAPEFRPFLNVARTFQDAFLYPGLTVLETVLVALDRSDRSGAVGSLIGAPWVRWAERRKREVAMRVLERVGLGDRPDTLASELSTGMRRLCDLASVIAANPGLVLLDEPTAGIAQREVEAFAPLLRGLRDDLGCAVLIVEHDVPLMMELCDRIYCLESGRIIAEGRPDEVRADPRVVASFLGTDAAAIERSGGGAAGRVSTAAPPATKTSKRTTTTTTSSNGELQA